MGCPAPPLGCLRDHFSLILSPSAATPPGKKKERSTGLFRNSEAWTQATWLKLPFWFKQSLVKCSSGLDAVVSIHWFRLVMSCWLGTVSLTINLIVLQLTNPRTWFLLAFRGRRLCLYCFPGGPLLTTLVHSQLHQRHLVQTTWFDGALLRVRKQTANIQPFFQSRPMP